MAARERENKLDDAARVRHYRSEPLPSAREAVVSTIRRNLMVGRLHAFQVVARIILPTGGLMLAGQLAGWVAAWLVGWLAGWVVGWLRGRTSRCTCRIVDFDKFGANFGR